MSSPVGNPKPLQPVVASPVAVAKALPSDRRTTPAATPAAPSTTVTLSSAALALQAASVEARETPAQTAQEAQHNDRQAQRLLAKEQAAKVGT